MSDGMELTGQVALVTGASSGIGRGIAVELGREGMVVVAAARSADKLATLVDEPRFAEIMTTMLRTTNRDRATIGLPPVDENYEVLTAMVPASLPSP